MEIERCSRVKYSWGINSKRFTKQKTVLQTFYNGGGMCGPIYISNCRHAGEQRVVRSHPFGDQCESAWGTISSQISWKRSTVEKDI